MIHQTKANSLRKITFRLNALKTCENKCYARETTFSQKRRGGDRRQGGREGKVAKGGGGSRGGGEGRGNVHSSRN